MYEDHHDGGLLQMYSMDRSNEKSQLGVPAAWVWQYSGAEHPVSNVFNNIFPSFLGPLIQICISTNTDINLACEALVMMHRGRGLDKQQYCTASGIFISSQTLLRGSPTSASSTSQTLEDDHPICHSVEYIVVQLWGYCPSTYSYTGSRVLTGV